MLRITVKSCTEKKKTDKYTIYEVITIDDNKYDSFEEYQPNDVADVEITPNDNVLYNARIKKVKATKTFVAKDTKRETALMCAVRTVGSEEDNPPQHRSKIVLTIAENYLTWLNQK